MKDPAQIGAPEEKQERSLAELRAEIVRGQEKLRTVLWMLPHAVIELGGGPSFWME